MTCDTFKFYTSNLPKLILLQLIRHLEQNYYFNIPYYPTNLKLSFIIQKKRDTTQQRRNFIPIISPVKNTYHEPSYNHEPSYHNTPVHHEETYHHEPVYHDEPHGRVKIQVSFPNYRTRKTIKIWLNVKHSDSFYPTLFLGIPWTI